MSVTKARITAMKAIIAGSCIPATDIYAINQEFDEVRHAESARPLARRRLLQILHSTRALDSFLKAFTDSYGCRGTAHSLGQYLRALESHTNPRLQNLTARKRTYFQSKVVDPRNKYLHEAGSSPTNDNLVMALLSDMQLCLDEVSSL